MIVAVILALVLATLLAASSVWLVRTLLGRVDQWQLDYSLKATAETEQARLEFELEVKTTALQDAADLIELLSGEISRDQSKPYIGNGNHTTVLRLTESWSRRHRAAAGEVPAITKAVVPASVAPSTTDGGGAGSSDVPVGKPD